MRMRPSMTNSSSPDGWECFGKRLPGSSFISVVYSPVAGFSCSRLLKMPGRRLVHSMVRGSTPISPAIPPPWDSAEDTIPVSSVNLARNGAVQRLIAFARHASAERQHMPGVRTFAHRAFPVVDGGLADGRAGIVAGQRL